MSGFALNDKADTAGPHVPKVGEMTRGALVLIGAALALVVVAFIVMQAVTGPNGWATRVATTAYTTDAVLVSGPLPPGMAN